MASRGGPSTSGPPPVGATRGVRTSLVESCSRLIRHLEERDDILLLTTSTRYREHTWDIPKSTQLALRIRDHLTQRQKRVTHLDIPTLKIHTCEGNISALKGNRCGLLEAVLPDPSKNPTGQHRCWASINNADDQLYVITRELFRSRAVDARTRQDDLLKSLAIDELEITTGKPYIQELSNFFRMREKKMYR